MKKTTLSDYRKSLLKKFYRDVTGIRCTKIEFIEQLNEDEIIVKLSNDETILYAVMCDSFITTYNEELEMLK